MKHKMENEIRLDELVRNKKLSVHKALRLSKRIIKAYINNIDSVKDINVEKIVPHSIIISENKKIHFDTSYVPVRNEKNYEKWYAFLTEDGKEVYKAGLLLNYLFSGGVVVRDVSVVKSSRIDSLVSRCLSINERERFNDIYEVYKRVRSICSPIRGLFMFIFGGALLCVVLSGILGVSNKVTNIGNANGGKVGTYEGYKNGYESTYYQLDNMGIHLVEKDDKEGNISGNVADGSTAVYFNDDIYFVEDGGLYVINSYDSSLRVLSEDIGAVAIAIYDDFLYFSNSDGIFRTKMDKFEPEIYVDGIAGWFMIYSDVMFIRDDQHAGYYYRVDLKSNNRSQIGSKNDYMNVIIRDGKFIYIDEEREVSKFDGERGVTEIINDNVFEDICDYNDKLYGIILVRNNVERDTDRFIVSMDLDGDNFQILQKIDVDRINVTDSGFFCTEKASGNLIWISFDGSKKCKIVESQIADFSVVGRWIIYRNKIDNELWMVHTDGSDNRKVFIQE